MLFGTRYKKGTANSLGEEIERCNSHMSPFGIVTKNMGSAGEKLFTMQIDEVHEIGGPTLEGQAAGCDHGLYVPRDTITLAKDARQFIKSRNIIVLDLL